MNVTYTQRKQLKPWQAALFGIVFIIVGLVVLSLGISNIKTHSEKSATFIETTSVVTDYHYNSDGLQAIVVEYEVDGEVYKKISNSYSNMPKSLGTEVSIKYNPQNPKDAIWTSDSTNIVMPLFGIVFAVAGIFMLVYAIKDMRSKKNSDIEVHSEIY